MLRITSRKSNCTRSGQGKNATVFFVPAVALHFLVFLFSNRLTVELVKIEDGLFTGDILYHKQVVKTEEELTAIKVQREEKRRLKLERKKVQSDNVDRKLNDKQKSKQYANDEDVRTDEDDDAAYYKEEIGEEPDKGMSDCQVANFSSTFDTFHFSFQIYLR